MVFFKATLLLAVTQLFINAQKFRIDYMWAKTFKTFYRLHNLDTNWYQAKQICEAEGTTLLVPESLEEMDSLKVLISNMQAHYTAVFIGLHDMFSRGNFVNVKGQPISETFLELLWKEGSPNNINGTKECVVMTRDGLFDDRRCNDTYPFVCKIFANETKFNKTCNSYDEGYHLNENGKCYKYHVEPLSWHDAYMVCRAEEGDLAIINSANEASLVTGFLGEHLTSNAPDPNILFIGFSDLMFPYQYRTIKGETLKEAGYSLWSPLKYDMSTVVEEHCGAISRTGFLKIVSCDTPAMFLCQKFANASTY